MLKINNKFVSLLLSFLSLILLSSCSYETTTINLGSGFETWSFTNSSEYEFNENLIEVAGGKAQLKVLDLEHSGDDFNSGNHVGAYYHPLDKIIKIDIPPIKNFNAEWTPKYSNLVGYWSFDQQPIEVLQTSDSVIASIGHDCTITNTNTTGSVIGGGKIGNSLSFDGIDDSASCTDPVDGSLDFGTQSFSAFFWVNTTEDSPTQKYPLYKNGVNASNPGYAFNFSSALWRVYISDGTTLRNCFMGPANSFINKWTHVGFVVDRNAGTITCYADGVLKNSVSLGVGFGSVDNSSSLVLGKFFSSQFLGNLDEIGIWNDQLNDTEVSDLYLSQATFFNNDNSLRADWTPKYDNIVGYWKMDGNWQDSSGNGNHGITTGSPTFATESQVGSLSGSFNGTTDYLSTPRVIDSKNFTVAGWVKLDVIAGYSYPFWQGETQLRIDGAGVITGRYFDNSSFYTVTANTRAMSGQWYHLAMSTNGNNLSLYVNGIEEGTAVDISSAATPPLVANSILAKDEQPSFLPGQLDDLAVWGVGLTNHEINVIFNRQKQKYASQYVSEVLDLGSSSAAWPDLSWSTRLPFGKELIGDFDNNGNPDSESSADYSSFVGDLSNGLVGLWLFNNGIINQVNNISGVANNGATFINNYQLGGKALVLDGVNDNVEIPDGTPFDFNTSIDFSISFSASFGESGSNKTLVRKGSNGINIEYLSSSNRLRAKIGNCSMDISSAKPDGVWRHYVLNFRRRASCNVGDIEIYSDGVLDPSLTLALASNFTNIDISNSDPILVGNQFSSPNAKIDNLAIWSRALSDQEVQQLYRRGANRIKLQVKSCVDSFCNCKSYGSGGSETDCDGDAILNAADTDDIHKSEFIGPGGDGTTYYSEAFNRTNTEVTFNCALNITDSDSGVCAPDEISFSSGPKPTGPEFLNIDYTQFVTPPANRYAQYRVYMEADENTACGGEPCLPELTSVSLNPTGDTRYSSEYIKIKPKSPITFTKLISAEIDADPCATFRLSRSNTEYYFDGTSWVPVTTDTHRNPASVVESNLTKFASDHGVGELKVSAYLRSDASQSTQCSVNSIDIKYE